MNSDHSTTLACPWCQFGTVTIHGYAKKSIRICCAQCLRYYRVDTPFMHVTREIPHFRRLIFHRMIPAILSPRGVHR